MKAVYKKVLYLHCRSDEVTGGIHLKKAFRLSFW